MKRLYKSRKNKVIDGVCGGIAEYFDVDPVLVRIIFVLFLFLGGAAVIAYIVGMIIMPKAPLAAEQKTEAPAEKVSHHQETARELEQPKPKRAGPTAGALIIGIAVIILGGFFLLDNFDFPFFYRISWWFRHNFWDFIIPGIIILLGLLLIVIGSEK